MGLTLTASLGCQEDEGAGEEMSLERPCKKNRSRLVAGFNSVLVQGQWEVGETVSVGCFFSSFQNAYSAYIIFIINKSVDFK